MLRPPFVLPSVGVVAAPTFLENRAMPQKVKVLAQGHLAGGGSRTTPGLSALLHFIVKPSAVLL